MDAMIYILADSREADPIRRVRYVGRTINAVRRLKAHKQTALSGEHTPRACWMRSVYEAGGDVLLEPVAVVAKDACIQAEIDWVAHFKALGCDLMNLTDGGDGLLNPSSQTRERIGAAKRGHKFWVGKKHTPEAKAKIAAARRGRPMHPNTRERMKDPAIHAKIAATLRAKGLTPEELQAKREHVARYWHNQTAKAKRLRTIRTPEFRAQLSARANTPEALERLRQVGENNKGRKHSLEVRQARSLAQRGRTHTDSTKQKMSAWQQGANSHRAKLNWDDIHRIRAAHATGTVSQHALAREYQVTPRTINLIVHHLTWKQATQCA